MNPENTFKVPVPQINNSAKKACHTGSQTFPVLTVSVPGSKSITNRALLLATLADGTSVLRGVLFSDDSRHFIECLKALGFDSTVDEENCVVSVTGKGGAVPRKEADVYVGSAGTAARFISAYLGLSEGLYHMDSSEQMRRRPMAPLLSSLSKLGCEITYEGKEGYFPFTIKGQGFGKNQITVNIDQSSQFLSALLISSCLCKEDFTIDTTGTHGMSYITMTCKMMEQFGVKVTQPSPGSFCIQKGQHYQSIGYQIEPDVSAACYFYAMCPLLGIPVRVPHVHFDSLQGDVEFIRILEKLGCKATDTSEGILLTPPATEGFPGITVDMSACSDQAITMAALAPFADSPTRITGIGHIRNQESDRINAIVTELNRLSIRCTEEESAITIYPGTPRPCIIHTYEDHRMAMGFSLIGLKCPGVKIHNPSCCKKTFENYFEVFENAIQSISDMV